ncbi:MAG: winged helix-turn-helix domain-containing protein [Actinomycetales bacterium]|nr:winged helix-turn-helix domain-containing protein [Actinomycetales bacterium]
MTLSLAQARRVAVAAQGLAAARPRGQVTARHLQRVVDTVGVLQIDSVNVLSRSHYLPLFSRLGPYPRPLADRAASRSPRRLVETWAHEASFVPPGTYRLLGWRRDRAAEEVWGGLVRVSREHPGLLDEVVAVVRSAGPATSLEIERTLVPAVSRTSGSWWDWSDTKRAVEYLFRAGRLASAGRTAAFERRYDLPERVVPPAAVAAGAPDRPEAIRQLVAVAARAHGVATESCLRDYFRLRTEDTRRAVTELVEAGVLLPVQVRGWGRPAFLHHEARLPRRVDACALLSPFDSLVWERRRAEELFGFRFRLEIYVPAARRVHGYYVLPFLLGDRLVARVDLKADRPNRALLVRAAWAESGAEADVPRRLAGELGELARWLELDRIMVGDRGDLSPALAVEVARREPTVATAR